MKITDAHILAKMNICQKHGTSSIKPCCFYDINLDCCSVPKQPCDSYDNEVDRIIAEIKKPKLNAEVFET